MKELIGYVIYTYKDNTHRVVNMLHYTEKIPLKKEGQRPILAKFYIYQDNRITKNVIEWLSKGYHMYDCNNTGVTVEKISFAP